MMPDPVEPRDQPMAWRETSACRAPKTGPKTRDNGGAFADHLDGGRGLQGFDERPFLANPAPEDHLAVNRVIGVIRDRHGQVLCLVPGRQADSTQPGPVGIELYRLGAGQGGGIGRVLKLMHVEGRLAPVEAHAHDADQHDEDDRDPDHDKAPPESAG
jgi:hypothetical protein